jgi:hypothetical protein
MDTPLGSVLLNNKTLSSSMQHCQRNFSKEYSFTRVKMSTNGDGTAAAWIAYLQQQGYDEATATTQYHQYYASMTADPAAIMLQQQYAAAAQMASAAPQVPVDGEAEAKKEKANQVPL